MKSIFLIRHRSSTRLLILPVALFLTALPVIQSFAAINRSAYQYAVTSCTEGSDLQKERCKDQSAEAMVYRLHKGITGTNPTNPLYSTWLANFKNSTPNAKPIDLAILVANTTSSSNNQTYLDNLYQNFLCNPPEKANAVAEWKAQLDGNKQTRAQIALHLAKRPVAMGCMRAGFLEFLQNNPSQEPTLSDISVTCTTEVGESCSVAAPQYCLSSFVTQPAHGTSTIIAGNIVYTPTGNNSAQENYAHLRQNGSATAKCNVKIVFEEEIDNGKRLHVTFVGVGFDGLAGESQFQSKVSLYRSSINQYEPFLSNQNKIVYHDIDAPLNSGIACSGGYYPGGDPSQRLVNCNRPVIDSFLASNGVPADKVIVVVNNPSYGGSADSGGAIVYADGSTWPANTDPIFGPTASRFATLNIGSDTYSTPGNTAVHEFAHTMGLNDEYVSTTIGSEVGIDFRAGQCMPMNPGTNWREPTPFSITWWDEFASIPEYPDTRGRTSWHQGCNYNVMWRPSESSIMSTDTNYFNDLSIYILHQAIKHYID